MKCPRCGKMICDCLLDDPGFLARAVGKEISRLSGCGAPSLPTKKNGTGSHEDRNQYFTPAYALEPLLPYLQKDKVIWEAAWGTGQLAGHLRQAGYQVAGGPQMDFLHAAPPSWDLIVTNPPFDRKDDFLHRAYALGKPFAFLLPLRALEGKVRHRLYREHGVEIIIPDRYIHFESDRLRDDHCPFPTAWFCWQLGLPQQLNFVEATW